MTTTATTTTTTTTTTTIRTTATFDQYDIAVLIGHLSISLAAAGKSIDTRITLDVTGKVA